MSRRPRRNRPPRLDADPVAAFTHDPGVATPSEDARAKVPTLRRRVVEARIAGPHSHFGRDGFVIVRGGNDEVRVDFHTRVLP